jgi:hypothetical protein
MVAIPQDPRGLRPPGQVAHAILGINALEHIQEDAAEPARYGSH